MIFIDYLLFYILELSKKYVKIGQFIKIQCSISPEMFLFILLLKTNYINTLNNEDNKNLRSMMDTINLCSPPEFINDIRKTEELIKLVNLLLQ